MQKYIVRIRNQVHIDIYSHSHSLYQRSLDRELAKDLSKNFYTSIATLAFMPYRFEKQNKHYHRMVVSKKYKIIYRIDEELKKVIVIRIFRVEMQNLKI